MRLSMVAAFLDSDIECQLDCPGAISPSDSGLFFAISRQRDGIDPERQNPSRHKLPGILTQSLFDNTHRLDKLTPVHRCQESETADAVAYGNLIGGLLLVLRLHQLVNRKAGVGELLFDPGKRQGRAALCP